MKGKIIQKPVLVCKCGEEHDIQEIVDSMKEVKQTNGNGKTKYKAMYNQTTDEICVKAIELRENKMKTWNEIADKFGVNPATIQTYVSKHKKKEYKTEVELFTCEIDDCKYYTPIKERFNKHAMNHEKPEVVDQPKASKIAVKAGKDLVDKWNKEVKKHTPKQKLICDHKKCSFQATTQNGLEWHVKRVHLNEKINVNVVQEIDPDNDPFIQEVADNLNKKLGAE